MPNGAITETPEKIDIEGFPEWIRKGRFSFSKPSITPKAPVTPVAPAKRVMMPGIAGRVPAFEKYLKEPPVPFVKPKPPPEPDVMPSLAWADKVKEIGDNPEKLIPFVGSGKEIFTISKLLLVAKKYMDNEEISQEDLLLLYDYVARSQRDTTWGYKVGSVITDMIPFAGEFIATGGIYSIGRKAGVEVAKQALKKIATKQGAKILEGKLAQYGVDVVGTVAGGTLRTIPMGVTRIPAKTLEKQLIATLNEDDESVWESARKAFGEQWVEIVSESTGGLFRPLTAPIKGQLVRLGLFKAFQKANPLKNANNLRRIAEKSGYHGVLEEMLEERVADVGHGILEPLGLSDQKFNIPSLQQLSVELAAFSIPGVAFKAVEDMARLKKYAKIIAFPYAGIMPVEGGRPEVPPEEAWYVNRWDTSKLGRKVQLAKDAGWVNKQGQLTKQGERIAESKWNELSPAAQKVIKRGLDKLYGKPIAPKEVPPITPEVTKIQPTFENLVEGQTLVDQSGERRTITAINKKGVPARWGYTTKEKKTGFIRTRPLGEIERYEKIEQPVAIPKAEAGMPEAGIQPSMLPEEVAAKEVRPVGKGVPTQISMDEQLKLQQMRAEAVEETRRAAEEAPPEEKAAYEAQAEVEGLKYLHETDPVAQFRFQMGTKIVGKGKNRKVIPNMVGLDSLISIREGDFPETFTVKQANAVAPYPPGRWAKYSQKGLKTYNKVPRDSVLDEIAQKLGYPADSATEVTLGDRVMQIKAEKKRIRELESDIPSPLLAIPEETTLPMPDEVKTSEDRVVMPPPPPKEPPPPEPPPTYAPQPAPIEAGRITMPDLQAPQTVVDLYSKPDFWRGVANLPLVKKAVGLFNPSAVANNPAQQAIILRAALKDEGAQKAQAVMSHLWEIGTQERVWGKTDKYGYLEAEAFAGFTMDDIRTNPTKFLPYMTEQQKEWIKRASEIEKVKLEALKRNEIDINELSFEDGGEYAGRRVMGKFNDSGELIESGHIGVGGRVGAKQAFEKARVFKTAEEGILANYRYMNSDEALYYNTLGAYHKIADKKMAEWFLSKVDWRTTKAPEALVIQAESARLRLRKAQVLLAALNRAVRGERVPSATINSIATVYSDQADTLKNLISELQKPSPETADTVQILTAEAKALISEAKLEYYQAVNERARAREEAMRVKYEEASIAHPAFQGKIFTGAEAKEIAGTMTRGLQPQFIEALGAVNKVNAIGRFFMLAGDASPMAIQLQFLVFYRPVAYAKAWGGFVRALFDPEFQYRYYANNRDLINRHPTLILSGRGTEFTEFMGRGGLGKKLGVLAKPLVPFQRAFEGSLDVAGIELAKSLNRLSTTPERTLEVDQFINEFRGLTSSARIGVSSMQRQMETGILLAPRYNRAIAGYLFDVVHGGLRGALARKSLAQGFAGLAAMAVVISIALGEDEDEIWEHFNPESPKFFTWDVAGVKIGLGGKVRSVIKLFGNMTRTGEVGQPALNFLRGNLSPGASTGLDLLTGKNYIGEPTRDNVLDFTKTVGRNFMMIWTQNFLQEGGTLRDKAIIATAEFLGLRGYDISAKKELKIKDLEAQLGQVIGKTPLLTKKKPDIYTTRNMYSDIKRVLQNIMPEEILADKGYAPWGHIVVRIEQSEGQTLPDIALVKYNTDPAKGDTLSDFMKQWEEKQKITEAGEKAEYIRVKVVEGKEKSTTFKGLAALKAHKVDYPKAHLGNVTRRQYSSLTRWQARERLSRDELAEISVNPRNEWLKSHPKENAEWALFELAPILTQEAYKQFKSMVKELDVIDEAIPDLELIDKEWGEKKPTRTIKSPFRPRVTK